MVDIPLLIRDLVLFLLIALVVNLSSAKSSGYPIRWGWSLWDWALVSSG